MQKPDRLSSLMREWRTRADRMSQDELGRRVGLSGSMVARVETGERWFGSDRVPLIVEALGLSVDEADVLIEAQAERRARIDGEKAEAGPEGRLEHRVVTLESRVAALVRAVERLEESSR